MTTQAEPFPASVREWVPDTRTMLIGGRMVDGDGEVWDVLNPATEAVIATVTGASAGQVDAAVEAAREAFPGWAALSGQERARHIHRFADVLEANACVVASIIACRCSAAASFGSNT